MKYDILLSLAPSAPKHLLEQIAGALEAGPDAGALMTIAEGLHEAAAHHCDTAARFAAELREVASIITAGIPSVTRPADRPLPLVQQLYTALADLLDTCQPTHPHTRQATLAWYSALAVVARARQQLGAVP